ncbi:MAG: SMP-30/gluconolactonase/LRE family protein [Vicinamibacterales bacterium]
MKTQTLLVVAAVFASAMAVVAQQQVGTPGVQAGRDPNRAAFVAANCKAQPAAAAPAAPAGQNAGRGGGGAQPAVPPVLIPADPAPPIAGVLATGQRWRKVWEGTGNNTDGATGTDKGLLLAQNDLSQIVEISLDGKVDVIAKDTFTGGALGVTPDGTLYVGTRALNRGIWRVTPRTLFTNTMNGEPLECLGPAVLNDMVADKKGGFYLTMGGVYYANAKGVVSGRYGTVGGNGIVVSPDDKTLYVTGRLAGAMPPADLKLPAGAPTPTGGLVAFDIQPDGSLTNERQFAWAGGDGSAVDTAGRIYTPGNNGAWVIDPANGQFLGYFPTPAGTHGLHFGGPGRRTLFSLQLNVQTSVHAIDTQVRGYQATEWKR